MSVPTLSTASAQYGGLALLSKLPPLPSCPNTEPTRNPSDAFRLAIADLLNKSLGVEVEKAFAGVSLAGMAKGGDYKVAIPRFRLGGKPADHAQKVVDAFQKNQWIEEVIAADGGFLTFNIHTPTLNALTLGTIHEMTYGAAAGKDKDGKTKSTYGTNVSGAGKRGIIEFSSPNIAKPFHAGHLRSTIIGAFIANLYEANGWYIERWNYLGDWGKQFGLLAVGFRHFGDEEKLKEDAVMHLYDVYVKINALASQDGGEAIHDEARAYFKAMEDGDEAAVADWKRFRDLSIEKYIKTYARLNIHFDVYSGESQVRKESLEQAMKQLGEAPFVIRDNGATLVDLTEYKLEKAIIERKDGTPLYITRDIAEARQRWDSFPKFDKMVYVVASQQDLHLAQFFKVLELMAYEWAQKAQNRLLHINFGMVQGMSTRKGTAVFLDHILEEAKDAMHEEMRKNEDKYAQVEDPERTADVIGMTAVKIQDMAAKRGNNYKFDWKRMTSFIGDTGPYLQYNHVRLCSVERKALQVGIELPKDLDPAKIRTELLSEPKARELALVLASWPDVVRNAITDHQPSTIVTFCFNLCHLIASVWEILIVKGQEEDLALARLWMFRCSKDVLSAALRLLTIEPLERM